MRISPGGNLPWSTQNFDWRQQNVNLSDTFSISPNMVNQFWVTYTRNFGGRLNTPQMSLGDLGSSFGVQGHALAAADHGDRLLHAVAGHRRTGGGH